MDLTTTGRSSGLGTIAGVIMGIGALVAVVAGLLGGGGKNDNQTHYEIPREGPTVTDYTPQIPPAPQQPVVMKPNIPAPAYVPTYVSSYPWGYNAYVSAIANTPMQTSTMNYQYYPGQDMSFGYYYASPKVIEYNTDYGRTLSYNSPKPYLPAAPPGMMQPQFTYNLNGQQVYQQPQPMINPFTPNVQPTVQPSCEYDFNKHMEAYSRIEPDGCVTAFKVPACYDNEGNWKGWS